MTPGAKPLAFILRAFSRQALISPSARPSSRPSKRPSSRPFSKPSEHRTTVVLRVAQLLRGNQRQAPDGLLAPQQLVDQRQRELLVRLGAEQVLETIVGKRVNVSPCFYLFHKAWLFACKNTQKNRKHKTFDRNCSTIQRIMRTFAANYGYAGVSPAAAASETPAYPCKAVE